MTSKQKAIITRTFDTQSYERHPGREAFADVVVYLAEARYVIGQVPHMDGDSHAGQWWPTTASELQEGDRSVMDSISNLAMTASSTGYSHSRAGASCPECEERSCLRELVADLLYRNQVLRFDLIEARGRADAVERAQQRVPSPYQGIEHTFAL